MKYLAVLLLALSLALSLYVELTVPPVSTGWVVMYVAGLWSSLILLLIMVWSKLTFYRPPMDSN